MTRLKIKSGHKNRLFQTNLKATLTYGADVHAFSPHRVRDLRASAGKDSGVLFKGAQVDLGWALSSYVDPIDIASRSLGRYAAEWWMTTAFHKHEHVHSDVLKAQLLR